MPLIYIISVVLRHRQGQFYRAIGFYKWAQRLFEEAKVPKALSSVYENLASVYFDKADYELAKDFYVKSLNLRKQIFDEKHPSIARSEMLLGKVYAHLQKYQDALDCYNSAIQYNENMGEIYINFGDLYSFQNEFNTAMDYYEKALAFYTDKYGNEHSCTAMAYSKTASALYLLDKYDQAMDHFMLALKIFQKVYPKDHKDIAVTLNNIANILVETNQFDVALGLYMRALEIYREHFSNTHPQLRTTRQNIAQCFRAMATKCVEKQIWQEALEFCQQALEIYEDVLPLNSKERESVLTTLKDDMNQLNELVLAHEQENLP